MENNVQSRNETRHQRMENRRSRARQKAGIQEVVRIEHMEDYTKTIAQARLELAPPTAPAIPCTRVRRSARQELAQQAQTIFKQINNPNHEHNENVYPKGYISHHNVAMVHTPISVKKARTIPAARDSVNKERKKLEKRVGLDLTKVQNKSTFDRWAKKNKRTVHFGTLMTLCHIKHNELESQHQTYKGRVVFPEGQRQGRRRMPSRFPGARHIRVS